VSDSGGITEVKARSDLADVVRRYVDLRMAGGRLMGVCPFHHESKPSFSVNPAEGFFYCFGCQASGDVIDFYSRINGLEFKEALAQLADEAGVELKAAAKKDPAAAEKHKRRKDIFAMNGLADEHFRRCLRHEAGKTAREYLKGRGVSGEIARDFALGYSLDDWHGLEKVLAAKGFSREAAVEAGLLSMNESGKIYDRFRGRLMFPIQDLTGKVVAFGARTLTGDDPKYLNTSETPVYTKGEHLYGLAQARRHMARSREGMLTEGYTDVISLHQFGFSNACGVLGTSLTAKQVDRLAGFCRRVDLVFDGDDAGRKAALRSAEMILTRGLSCRVVLLPEGEDVDSILHGKGAEAFARMAENAPEGLEFCLKTVRDEFAPKEVMDWAGKFLKDLAREDMAAYFIPKLASGLGLLEAELRRGLRPGARAAQSGSSQAPAGGTAAGPDAFRLGFFIKNPEYIGKAADKDIRSILKSEWAKALWDKLADPDEDDVVSTLNESEKRFWIQCRLEERSEPEEQEKTWNDILDELQVAGAGRRRKSIREALMRAQAARDEAEIQRLNQEWVREISREDR
jgi:DNA primase